MSKMSFHMDVQRLRIGKDGRRLYDRLHVAQCIACDVATTEKWQSYKGRTAMCGKCRCEIPFLRDERMGDKHWAATTLYRLTQEAMEIMVCYDCLYHKCTKCHKRTEFARGMGQNKDGLCPECRWPPCANELCKAPRPQYIYLSVTQCPQWFCKPCRPERSRTCLDCKEDKREEAFNRFASRPTMITSRKVSRRTLSGLQ